MYLYRCLFHFGILGPLLASLFVWILGPYLYFDVALTAPSENVARFAAGAGAAFFFFPFALYLGVVPGIATGLVYWLLKTRTTFLHQRTVIGILVMAVVGGAMCAVQVAVTEGSSALRSNESTLGFILPGVVAASLCVLILEHLHALQPRALEQKQKG